jgi:hypothetical protein
MLLHSLILTLPTDTLDSLSLGWDNLVLPAGVGLPLLFGFYEEGVLAYLAPLPSLSSLCYFEKSFSLYLA